MTIKQVIANNLRQYERTRAANIVKKYEDNLRESLSRAPNATNAHDVKIIIQRLEHIRDEIMGSYIPFIKRGEAGDFSLDEIAAAEELINET